MLHVTSFHHQGTRHEQEDRYKICSNFAGNKHLTLVYVCDGHGGYKAAEFLNARYETVLCELLTKCDSYSNYTVLMSQAFTVCVQEWDRSCFGNIKFEKHADKVAFFAQRDNKKWTEEQLESGTTFCAALIDSKERRLNILNIGDSRAVWICNYDKLIGSTVDHSVPLVMEPIPNFPFTYGDGYICEELAMWKSFGDNTLACTNVVSKIPDCLCVKLLNGPARLVVASDGFFDWVSNHGALYDEFADAATLAKQIPNFDDNVTIIYVKIAGLEKEERKEPLPVCAQPKSRSPARGKNNPPETHKKKVTVKKHEIALKSKPTTIKKKSKETSQVTKSFEEMLQSLHLNDIQNADEPKKVTKKKGVLKK